MTIEIREMRKRDYRESFDLWQGMPGLGLSGADEELPIHRFLDKNPATCFVALEGRRIIGTLLGGSDGRRGYIYHLAVSKNYQRMGVGKTLVDKCITAFKRAGLQKCHIFVISDNFEGLRFWEHTGWVKRNDILVMSKDL